MNRGRQLVESALVRSSRDFWRGRLSVGQAPLVHDSGAVPLTFWRMPLRALVHRAVQGAVHLRFGERCGEGHRVIRCSRMRAKGASGEFVCGPRRGFGIYRRGPWSNLPLSSAGRILVGRALLKATVDFAPRLCGPCRARKG
mgnify:CR=1 FL=1